MPVSDKISDIKRFGGFFLFGQKAENNKIFETGKQSRKQKYM